MIELENTSQAQALGQSFVRDATRSRQCKQVFDPSGDRSSFRIETAGSQIALLA